MPYECGICVCKTTFGVWFGILTHAHANTSSLMKNTIVRCDHSGTNHKLFACVIQTHTQKHNDQMEVIVVIFNIFPLNKNPNYFHEYQQWIEIWISKQWVLFQNAICSKCEYSSSKYENSDFKHRIWRKMVVCSVQWQNQPWTIHNIEFVKIRTGLMFLMFSYLLTFKRTHDINNRISVSVRMFGVLTLILLKQNRN